jgi:hypothetical protein
MAHIDTDPEGGVQARANVSFVNRSQRRLITTIAHGLKSNEDDKQLLLIWRSYMRTLWTDQNKPRGSEEGCRHPGSTREPPTVVEQAAKLIRHLRDEADAKGSKGLLAKGKRELTEARKGRMHAYASLHAVTNATRAAGDAPNSLEEVVNPPPAGCATSLHEDVLRARACGPIANVTLRENATRTLVREKEDRLGEDPPEETMD